MIDGTLLVELRLTADGKHLVQLNSDGRFFMHRVADGQRALIGAQVDDEIVIANDDGLYDTTYEGAQAVQVRFPGMRGLHRFNQFEAALRRPGLATDVLAGRSIAPPPAAMPVPPTAELTLAVAVRDGRRTGKVIVTAERGLAAARIYLDGRLVQQLGVNGGRAEIPVHLADPGGGRWISAVAVDAHGLVSQPSAVQMPGKPQARGTLRAVVIGVDTYEDRGLPRLAFAKSDAQRFVRALGASRGKSVQQVQATSLLDDEVTPARVLSAVRKAAQATTPDDMLVIFYAGHGLDGRAGGSSDAGLVLTTPKTRMADLKTTALPWAALAHALSEARGTIVVVLDACHAGIAGSDAFATNDDAVSALITGAGAPMVVLAGSKGRQLSHETAQAGGGQFTAAIAAVISEARTTHDRDRSGLIDLGELYGAVGAGAGGDQGKADAVARPKRPGRRDGLILKEITSWARVANAVEGTIGRLALDPTHFPISINTCGDRAKRVGTTANKFRARCFHRSALSVLQTDLFGAISFVRHRARPQTLE